MSFAVSKHLHNLNEAQTAAVKHDPNIPLQILAGPGSGKTRTLTCRIAHLIELGVPASKIVAVTFTNKAANELRVRLEGLIGKEASRSILLGTFHAICSRLLRQHGNKIKLANNFTIIDADEAKKLISAILKDTVAMAGAHSSGSQRINMKDSLAVEYISKVKSKGLTPEQLEAKALAEPESKEMLKGEISASLARQISPLYTKYVEDCRKNNALDFDDLLMFGVKLLEEYNDCVDCQHIFVDEFQDTNAVQFKLMTLFAMKHRNISIVGDPDQSIYGWRSAEIENLQRMRVLFPATQQIFLEDNYRSTGAIIAASVAIISEDKSRPRKTLRTSHPAGCAVTLGNCADEHEEAACIAEEIKRLKMISGGLLKWNDFSILLRFNALSRNLETALQKEGIPSQVLAGQKFFDRVEVKDLVAYLQLIDNPSFDQGAYRILNVPKRAIGDKSISELRERALKQKKPVMLIVEQIVEGRIPDINPPLRGKARLFIQTMRNMRTLALQQTPVAEMLEKLLTELGYADHLQKSYPDWESRWENVRELITFATESKEGGTASHSSTSEPNQQPSTPQEGGSQSALGDTGLLPPEIPASSGESLTEEAEGVRFEGASQLKEEIIRPDQQDVPTPLRSFLQATSLSTDAIVKDDSSQQEKVTIATCHSAKGLEWPVVFVPSVEQGIFPFYRSEDAEEERRLLYVACTRAQAFLYLTHAARRRGGGEVKDQTLSEFLTVVLDKDKQRKLFTHQKPTLNYSSWRIISRILERECPRAESIEQGVQDYYKSQKTTSMKSEEAPTKPIFRTHSGTQPETSEHTKALLNTKSHSFTSASPSTSQRNIAHSAVFSSARSIVGHLPQVQNLPSETFSSHTKTSSSLPSQATLSFKAASTGTSPSTTDVGGEREIVQNVAPKRLITSFYRPQVHRIQPPSVGAVKSSFVPPSSASSISSPQLADQSVVHLQPPLQPPPKVAGAKRRLGMSSRTEYPRKK